MKKTIVLSLITVFSFNCCNNQLLFAQDSVYIQLANYIRNLNSFPHHQEKVYLHFDNTGYYLGETIWFKAYVVNATSLCPEPVSKVLYVELLNSRGIVLETKKLQITNGQCHGDFYLTTRNYDYHPGYYELRAYTKNMLNFGDETIFSRVLPVFDQPKKEGDFTQKIIDEGKDVKRLCLPRPRTERKTQKAVNIDFYPEGGHLIAGRTNRLAFKITDELGNGIKANGTIYNEQNQVVTEFSSVHQGMGVFSYTPDAAKNRLELRYGNRTYKFSLPVPIPSGYTMQANTLPVKNILIALDRTADAKEETLGLSVMCRGKVLYFTTIPSGEYPLNCRIPKSELGDGVHQITLFNAEGKVYAERLIFIYPQSPNDFYIQTKADKNTYQWRQTVNIELKAKPNMTFSLAVRDADNTPLTADQGNALTNLLLSSDLKGCIENPSYYLAADDIEHRQAVDLLMMVQGWRRYEWQQMAGVIPFSPAYKPEKMLTINGHLEGNKLNIKDYKEVQLEIALGKRYLNATSPIDAEGRFSVDIDTAIVGDYYMFLQSDGLSAANKCIRLDRWFSPAPKTYTAYETDCKTASLNTESTNQKQENSIISGSDSLGGYHEIKEVVVTNNSKRGKDLIYNVEKDRDRAIDKGVRYPENAVEYMLENAEGVVRLDDGYNDVKFLQNDLSFRYMIDDRKWKHIMTDNRYLHWRGNKTCFVDLENIKKIVISDWKVENRQSNVTDRVFSYVYANLYPYDKTPYYLMRQTPSYRVTSFEGYSTVKDFYAGRPERENQIPTKTEHSRTLYWNPAVKTDNQGNVKISFVNNAFCKKIEISAQGVSKDGTPMANR